MNNFAIYKLVSNLVNIVNNYYYFSKFSYYLMIFLLYIYIFIWYIYLSNINKIYLELLRSRKIILFQNTYLYILYFHIEI